MGRAFNEYAEKETRLKKLAYSSPLIAPSAISLVASLLTACLLRSRYISERPKFTSVYISFLTVLLVLFLGALVVILTVEPPRRMRTWILVGILLLCPFLALFAVFFSPLKAGRELLAVAAASLMNAGFLGVWTYGNMRLGRSYVRWKYWPLAFFFVIALAALCVSLSAYNVYRRQHKLEKAFQEAMREKEMRRGG